MNTRPKTIPQTAPGVAVRAAKVDETDRLIATLTTAFSADPPARWVFRDAATYLQGFPRFVRAFCGQAPALGSGWCTEGFGGCALWLPPGEGPNEAALVELTQETVPAHRHEEVFALLEAMGRTHPEAPHWYLPLIGVDAAAQGRGIGSTLLAHALAVVDRDGLPAYLEATSPRNVPLYERFGFRAWEPIRVSDCPPITPMWREPGGR